MKAFMLLSRKINVNNMIWTLPDFSSTEHVWEILKLC